MAIMEQQKQQEQKQQEQELSAVQEERKPLEEQPAANHPTTIGSTTQSSSAVGAASAKAPMEDLAMVSVASGSSSASAGQGAAQEPEPEEGTKESGAKPATMEPTPRPSPAAKAPVVAWAPADGEGVWVPPPEVRVLGFSVKEEGRLVGSLGTDAKTFSWTLSTPLVERTELTAKVESVPTQGKVLTVRVNGQERYRGHLREAFTLPLRFQGTLPDMGKFGVYEVRAGTRATFFGQAALLNAAASLLHDPAEVDPDVWCPAVITKMRKNATFEAECQVPDPVYGTRKVRLESVPLHDLRNANDRNAPVVLPEWKALLRVPVEAPHKEIPSLLLEGQPFENLFCAPTPPPKPPASQSQKGGEEKERGGVLDLGLRLGKDRRLVEVPCGERVLHELSHGSAVSLGAVRRRARAEFRFRLDGFGNHELVVEKNVTQFLPKDPRRPHGKKEPVLVRLDGAEVLHASSADLGDRHASGDWEAKLRLLGTRRIRTRVHESDHCGLPLEGTQELERCVPYSHEVRLFLQAGHDLTRLQLEIDGQVFTALEGCNHQAFASQGTTPGQDSVEKAADQESGRRWVRRDALEAAYPDVCRFPHVQADNALRPALLESASNSLSQPSTLLQHLGEAGKAWVKYQANAKPFSSSATKEDEVQEVMVFSEDVPVSQGAQDSGLFGWLPLMSGLGCMTDYRAQGLKLPVHHQGSLPALSSSSPKGGLQVVEVVADDVPGTPAAKAA